MVKISCYNIFFRGGYNLSQGVPDLSARGETFTLSNYTLRGPKVSFRRLLRTYTLDFSDLLSVKEKVAITKVSYYIKWVYGIYVISHKEKEKFLKRMKEISIKRKK